MATIPAPLASSAKLNRSSSPSGSFTSTVNRPASRDGADGSSVAWSFKKASEPVAARPGAVTSRSTVNSGAGFPALSFAAVLK